MSTANTQFVPPIFGASHEGIFDETDLDLDFKLLSEYLFDDNIVMQQATPMPIQKAGRRATNTTTSKAKSGGTSKATTKKRTTTTTTKGGPKNAISNEYLGDTGYDDDNFDDDFSDDDILEEPDMNGKSRQRVDKRRERNRVLARKTRLRKKFFFESLQRQVAQLTKENEMLKSIATTHLKPDTLKDLLNDSAELPPCVISSTQHANNILEQADFKLMGAIRNAQRSFCITDPSLPDNPIVFASPGFLELTGYTMEQVLGKNCRFLQGPRTDPGQIGMIRQGLADGKDVSVCFINYKADGTEFYNQLFIAGLRDSNHNLVNYVGVIAELNKRSPSEEALLDESLGRPAKKGRPKLKDKEDKDKKNNSGLLPMPPSVPSEIRQVQQQQFFDSHGNTSLTIPKFTGIHSTAAKMSIMNNQSLGLNVTADSNYKQYNSMQHYDMQDTVPELNFPDVDFNEISDPSWAQS